MSDFPVDPVTLVMLAEACRINPEKERTTLHDFLEMGTRVKEVTDEGTGATYASVDDALEGAEDEVPVFFVEHEPGFEPHSEHSVILALIAEIERLRSLLNEAA